MDTLLDRLISQLNTLIPFLALSHEEVFTTIQSHQSQWFLNSEKDAVPDTYGVYKIQVAHGAFLLGYSYVEAFHADLIRQVYRARPEALPRDKQLKFGEVLERSTYDDIVEHMIDREVIAVMYNSMEKIIEYFDEKLGIKWPMSDVDAGIEASRLRNCIIHNNSRVDPRLAELVRWSEGDRIELTTSDVHVFGLSVRTVARSLYAQADAKFFAKTAAS